MEEKNTVLFDPGFAPIVIDSIGTVGYTYYMFNALGDIRIKRANFPLVLRKIEHHLKINVCFYLGCLLWAGYIKSNKNATITGNELLNEKTNEQEYTKEIDFLIDFCSNKIVKEYKYYKNKFYRIDERYLPILESYKEFLIINKGFVACNNTNDIIIPNSLKKISDSDLNKVLETIQDAIKEKKLDRILELYNLLF